MQSSIFMHDAYSAEAFSVGPHAETAAHSAAHAQPPKQHAEAVWGSTCSSTVSSSHLAGRLRAARGNSWPVTRSSRLSGCRKRPCTVMAVLRRLPACQPLLSAERCGKLACLTLRQLSGSCLCSSQRWAQHQVVVSAAHEGMSHTLLGSDGWLSKTLGCCTKQCKRLTRPRCLDFSKHGLQAARSCKACNTGRQRWCTDTSFYCIPATQTQLRALLECRAELAVRLRTQPHFQHSRMAGEGQIHLSSETSCLAVYRRLQGRC